MTTIDLTGISGCTNPYTIYVCDVFGNGCILIANIYTTVPVFNLISLPLPYNTAPAVGIKVVCANGCEKFEIFNCTT